MACRTILRRLDTLLFDKLSYELSLIRSGLPLHVGHFGHRPQTRLGIAVAFNAPAHAQGLHLHHLFHIRDISMAFNAADADTQVSAVIEIDIIGQLVDAHPLDRSAFSPSFAQRDQLLILLADQSMAVHAGLDAGDIGVGRNFDLGVAVAAVHPQVSGVELMTVGDGLDGAITGVGVFRRAVIPKESDHGQGQRRGAGQHDDRKAVGFR